MSSNSNSLLVVDDNEMNRDMLSRRLARKGYSVEVAEDGTRALAMIEEQHFDAILLDVMMPGINGIDVLKEIRKDHSQMDLPVIMATAKDLSEDIVEALRLGASDYVTKPLDFPVVLARVRTQVSLKESVDEIKRLEGNLEQRNRELQEAVEQLKRANLRMKSDLDAAARIQQAQLPTTLPEPPGVRFAWSFEPCDELAGDTLGVIQLDDGHVGLYVLDVSGHGVPASLLSVSLTRALSQVSDGSSILKQRIEEPPGYRLRPPAEVAQKLNERFPWSEGTGQFFSLFYGLLDLETRELEFASAGHPGPVHVPADADPRILDVKGIAIGIMEDAKFEAQSLVLGPGDRLYLYSDGIPEAANPDYDLYEDDRMLDCLGRGRSATLEDSLTNLLDEVTQWCGDRPIADDISLLAIEVGA